MLVDSLVNQLIKMQDGAQYMRIVRNIEDFETGSIYGEVVIDEEIWVVRRQRMDVWVAIGKRVNLDAAVQGLDAEATPEQQRRLAPSTWKECIARNL